MNFYGFNFLVFGLDNFRRVCAGSELRSSSHASARHNLFLDGAHLLEGTNVANGAVLEASPLLLGKLILTEAGDAVSEAVLDHGELHLHLSLHLHLLHQLLVHLSLVILNKNINNFISPTN